MIIHSEKTHRSSIVYGASLTLFIDLDDTLVDTFGLLITPLEQTAVETVIKKVGGSYKSEELLERLLELRLRQPARVEEELRRAYPKHAMKILEIRRSVFADFSIAKLKIGSAVVAMLKDIARRHTLILLTEGFKKIQTAKIEHLGIEKLFREVLIVEANSSRGKKNAIATYMTRNNVQADNIVVVGNRLDREIRAGRDLGTKTVWVRSGEGSQVDDIDQYDFVIDSILNLPSVLDAVEEHRE